MGTAITATSMEMITSSLPVVVGCVCDVDVYVVTIDVEVVLVVIEDVPVVEVGGSNDARM